MYRHDAARQPPVEDELQLDTSEYSPPATPQFVPAKLTDGAQQIIGTAKEAAAKSHRVFIDSVDVLLAMLHEPDGLARRVLANLGVDADLVKRSLREEVSRDEPSDAYRSALEARSLAEARWMGRDDAGLEHLLLALCQIRPSAATDILMRLGAQPRDLCREVLQILGHGDDWQRWLADHPDM
jgi:ATP-dependent Clp protease ATP-binding subunit ClpB